MASSPPPAKVNWYACRPALRTESRSAHSPHCCSASRVQAKRSSDDVENSGQPGPKKAKTDASDPATDFRNALRTHPLTSKPTAQAAIKLFDIMRREPQHVPTSKDSRGYTEIGDGLATLLDAHRTVLGYPNRVSKDSTTCSPSKRLVLLAGAALCFGKFKTAGAAKKSFKGQSGNSTAESMWNERLVRLEALLRERAAAADPTEGTTTALSDEPSADSPDEPSADSPDVSGDGSSSTSTATPMTLVPQARVPWTLPACLCLHEPALTIQRFVECLSSHKNSQEEVAAIMEAHGGPPQHVNSWGKAYHLSLEASIVQYVKEVPHRLGGDCYRGARATATDWSRRSWVLQPRRCAVRSARCEERAWPATRKA